MDILASGQSTPSLPGDWDLSFDALDDIPSRGRNAIVNARRPQQNMLFWWQKVKTQLASALGDASDEELDDMVLSVLKVELPLDSSDSSDSDDDDEEAPAPRRRVRKRKGVGSLIEAGNGLRSRPVIPGPIRDALMVYFAQCVELHTAPNECVFVHLRHQFLSDAPPSPVEPEGGRRGRARMRCLDEKSGKDSGHKRRTVETSARGTGADEAEAGGVDGLGVYVDESEGGSLAEWDPDGEDGDDSDDGASDLLDSVSDGEEDKGTWQTHQVGSVVGQRGMERERQTLRMSGCLFPRLPSVAALSAFLSCAHWLREIDVSSNDLRGEGTAILCAALRDSLNPLDTLILCKSPVACFICMLCFCK